jgi:hypothetical protein
MRRFTLYALVLSMVLSFALANPMQASAQDPQAPSPIPVFMPPPSAYAPILPVVPCVTVLSPVCEPAPDCPPPAPVCLPTAPVCQPACPPAPIHRRFEQIQEREAHRIHDWRCRR